MALLTAGCSASVDPVTHNGPAARLEDAHALPRFEEVAYAAAEQLGRCMPDCGSPAPFLGITRVACATGGPDVARCNFTAFSRRFDLTAEDHGFVGMRGDAMRCTVTMRQGQGAHDVFWGDAAADPLRRRATSTLRCAG